MSKETNTTIMVFRNGTNYVVNGDEPDSAVLLKTIEHSLSSLKDVFKMVLNV